MSETTQEERDRLRDRTGVSVRQDTNTFLRPGALLRLLNDADRLAALEQRVRRFHRADVGRVSPASSTTAA